MNNIFCITGLKEELYLKKLISLVLVFAFIFAVLAGCAPTGTPGSSTETTQPGSDSKPAAKTTLNFWTFQELHNSFMDDAVETWNKANLDRQIELKQMFTRSMICIIVVNSTNPGPALPT